MRKLLSNKDGDMEMILTAIILGIVIAIGIIITWNVHGSVTADLSTIDTALDTARGESGAADTAATNASQDVEANLGTFFTIAPITLIVVAAVGILSYVLLLRRR